MRSVRRRRRWLARHGWRVTAVDISATAVDRVRRQALELGLGDRVVAEQHDVATSFPSGEFDLISAQYFHTPFALPRRQVLRTAAHALRPGGLLLLVDHGSIAPWSWNQDPDTHFPTPDEVFAEMDLDPRQWSPERTEMPRREATGPNGETAVVVDNVLLVRRAGPARPGPAMILATLGPCRHRVLRVGEYPDQG